MEKSDNGLCLQQLSIFVPESDAVINVLDGSEHIKLDLDRWNDRLVVDIFESLSNKVHTNPPVHIIVHHDNPNDMIVSEMREEELLSRLLYLADPSSSGKSCKSGEIMEIGFQGTLLQSLLSSKSSNVTKNHQEPPIKKSFTKDMHPRKANSSFVDHNCPQEDCNNRLKLADENIDDCSNNSFVSTPEISLSPDQSDKNERQDISLDPVPRDRITEIFQHVVL